jgi:hypothetical protein
LERDNPGIVPDPNTLHLRLQVTEPADPQPQVLTPEHVTFEEETEAEYRWVEINHGEVARIEVQHPQ